MTARLTHFRPALSEADPASKSQLDDPQKDSFKADI
jgi:hypothetical protein